MRVLKLEGKKSVELIINGQGIYVFNFYKNQSAELVEPVEQVEPVEPIKNIQNSHAHFTLLNSDGSDGLEVNFSLDKISVKRIGDGTEYQDSLNNSGLSEFTDAYYWFSLDAQNLQFYAGIGEARLETVKYKYLFELYTLTYFF